MYLCNHNSSLPKKYNTMRNLLLFFTILNFSSTMFSQVNHEISYTTSFDSNLIYSRVDTFTTNFLVIRHEINNKEKIYTNSFVNFDGKTNHLIIKSNDNRANYESNLIFGYESRTNDKVEVTYETMNDEIVYINYRMVNNIKIPISVSVYPRFRGGIMYITQ